MSDHSGRDILAQSTDSQWLHQIGRQPTARQSRYGGGASLTLPEKLHATRPQQFLYFLPLPQGHGSLRPTFGIERRIGRSSVISPAPSPYPATTAITPTGCSCQSR